jgi:class 3 adenylate cyclase
MTVMFCDVRSYTTLAERMSPREAFAFINEHLTSVGPLIREHYGVAAQFYGDGIMAIFPRSPADAVQAAVRMQQRVDERNAQRTAEGRPAIRIGIGLNSGPLTIGVIGDGMRADTGVVGDTVNSAARMEGLSKTYGVRIVAAGRVLEGFETELPTRFLDRVTVRGREQPVAIYDVFAGDEEPKRTQKAETLAAFNAGLEHFDGGRYVDALKCFGDVLEVMPEDRTTQLYLERSARFLLEPHAARVGE